jgi:hypothetical protein
LIGRGAAVEALFDAAIELDILILAGCVSWPDGLNGIN